MAKVLITRGEDWVEVFKVDGSLLVPLHRGHSLSDQDMAKVLARLGHEVDRHVYVGEKEEAA